MRDFSSLTFIPSPASTGSPESDSVIVVCTLLLFILTLFLFSAFIRAHGGEKNQEPDSFGDDDGEEIFMLDVVAAVDEKDGVGAHAGISYLTSTHGNPTAR